MKSAQENLGKPPWDTGMEVTSLQDSHSTGNKSRTKQVGPYQTQMLLHSKAMISRVKRYPT